MAERPFQPAAHRLAALIAASLQAQIVARAIVDDGQRMALGIVAEPHPALEVHLPQQVRRRHLEALDRRQAADRRRNQVMTAKNRMHRRDRRRIAASLLKSPGDLPRSPSRMRSAHRDDRSFGLIRAARRRTMRPPRTVGKGPVAGLEPLDPLIADCRVDAEPPA